MDVVPLLRSFYALFQAVFAAVWYKAFYCLEKGIRLGMEKFQCMMEEVRALVKEKIENRDHRPDYMLEKQLYAILDELDQMEKIRNIRLFYPYYPKGIADCWDESNPLTAKLLDLLELYREL